MALSFDHVNKHIEVPQGDAQPLLMQTLINQIRDEEASERGIAYDQIADASGKNELGGGVMTGITVALRSSWMLEFDPGAYQATLTGGNLADALARVFNTGSPQVLIQASASATIMEVGTSGLTAEESAQLAAAAAGASDPADISAAVLAAMNSTPPSVDIKKVNTVPLAGSGTGGDPWRPA